MFDNIDNDTLKGLYITVLKLQMINTNANGILEISESTGCNISANNTIDTSG